MKKINAPGFIFSVLILSGLCTGGYAASIKCWTNNEGGRECGATVPPEYVQQGHQEISKQGLIINEQERAKTAAEIAEQERLADLEKEKLNQAEEQARRDKILLDTFSNVDDIEMARDGKIAAIESSIMLALKRNEKIQADLDNRIKAAAEEERKGKVPNDVLLSDIESLKRQASNNHEFVNQKNIEKEEVMADYNTDIERFLQLKQDSGQER